LEDSILATVNLSDDADTTAIIYGQLACAYYGFRALHQKWIKHVYAGKSITCFSKWIVYEDKRWFKRGSSTLKIHNSMFKL